MSPGQTNTKPDKAELEAAIDALLKDIDTTCSRFENPVQAQEDDELAEYTRAVEAANMARAAAQTPAESAPPADTPAEPSAVELGDAAERAIEASTQGMNTLLEEAADRLIESLEQEITPSALEEAEPTASVPDTEPAVAAEAEAPAEGESPVGATDPAEVDPTPAEDPSDLLASALDSLLAEDAEPEPAPETVEPAAAIEPVVADPEPATTPEQATTSEQAEPAEPGPDIFADLDAAFDDLLDGTFETADGQAVDTDGVDTSPDRTLMLDTASPVAATPVAAPAPASPAEPLAKTPEVTAAEKSPPQVSPTPAAQPVAPAVEPTPEPVPFTSPVTKTPKRRKQAGGVDGIWLRVRPLIDGAVRGVGRFVRPLGARMLILLSKPLEGKPPQVRDSIGWVALWTLFLAVCVWAYAMLRPVPVPANDGRASAVVTPDTPRDP